MASVATSPPANRPSGITSDGTFVYWTDEGDATVLRAPAGTGAPGAATALAQGVPWTNVPTEIIADATSIYWLDTGTKEILRLAK